MRDAVADVAHAVEQVLDLIEHRVDVLRELVVLVVAAFQRRAPAQVARHDLPRRAVELGEPPLRTDGEQDAADERQRERQRDAVIRCAAQHLPDCGELADVAADEQTEARPDAQQHRSHRRVAVGLHEVDPLAARVVDAGWPILHVAGEAPADGVREQIERAPLGIALYALLDDVGQAAQAAAFVLLVEADDLGFDDRVRLRVEVTERRPVDERGQRADRQREQRHVGERQPEHAGAEQARQLHMARRDRQPSSR